MAGKSHKSSWIKFSSLPSYELANSEEILKLTLKVFISAVIILLLLNIIEIVVRAVAWLTFTIIFVLLGAIYTRSEKGQIYTKIGEAFLQILDELKQKMQGLWQDNY